MNTSSLSEIGDHEESPILNLSPKNIQAFYHAITGETENLNRYFNELYQAEESDIENLHNKIIQTIDQYDVIANNLQVKVYFENDQSEKFSSFERFRIQGKAEARRTEAVVLKYNFLIKLPQTNTTQSYEIFVRIASNIIAIKEMQKETPSFMWNRLKYKNGHVAIEFVDYTVARALMATIAEWFEGLPRFKPNPIFDYFKRKSDSYTTLFRSVFILLYLVFFWFSALSLTEGTSAQLLKGIVVSVGLVTVIGQLGWWFGVLLRNFISAYIYPSYVCLTNGDRRMIEQLGSQNKAIMKFNGLLIFLNIAISIGCSVAGSYIYNLIK